MSARGEKSFEETLADARAALGLLGMSIPQLREALWKARRDLDASKKMRAAALDQLKHADVEIRALKRERVELRKALTQIANATTCPDPAAGGCIGGPIPGVGCVNEAAWKALSWKDPITSDR